MESEDLVLGIFFLFLILFFFKNEKDKKRGGDENERTGAHESRKGLYRNTMCEEQTK